MRTNKELVKLLLEKAKIWITDKGKIQCSSICSIIRTLEVLEMITAEEKIQIDKIILTEYHPESYEYKRYYWKPGLIEPRVKWLENIIKNLK